MAYRKVRKPTKDQPGGPTVVGTGSSPLRALTAAALALPGLSPTLCRGAGSEEAGIDYSLYQEGRRQAVTGSWTADPIRNDNFQANSSLTFFDRYKLSFGYTQDTWSGATPLTTAPYASFTIATGASPAYVTNNSNLAVDRDLNFYTLDRNGNYIRDNRTIHMLASASPETRKQGNFSLGYEWDDAALSFSGGLSLENDYESRFGGLSGHVDFNQKMTTVSLALNYTNSDVSAVPAAGGLTYIDRALYTGNATGPQLRKEGDVFVFRGDREDWSARAGLSQVLDANSLLETNLSFSRSAGFLENPYKAVTFIFVDPTMAPDPVDGLLRGFAQPAFENRPDSRNQWSWNLTYARYVDSLRGSLHAGYRFYHDDWGIDAHTFEASWGQELGEGWTITPRVRYYSQDAADFYRPYYLFNQAVPRKGNVLDYDRVPVKNYSSDHRLSGFGALSGGVLISKVIARGAATLEAGVEYYTHDGALKLGGGGEGDYANFDSYLMNVGLRVNLSPMLEPVAGMRAHNSDAADHTSHDMHQPAHHMARGPAGVMLDHMLTKAGDYMFGYRYLFSLQSGLTLQGADPVGDAAIVARGCDAPGCGFTPQSASMHMHMLDLMYAPTDWLNLMLMPQVMDMEMNLRELAGGVDRPSDSLHAHHTGGNGGHTTGGIGDTRVYALVRLYENAGQHAHMGLGLSAPTGDTAVTLSNGELQHYHMQLGSGTWDLLPSITYSGHENHWLWGAQVNGVVRLEDANASGFAFGDMLQVSAWGGYRLNDWLTTTLRGVYSTQGRIDGRFNAKSSESSPADYPGNYGGRYWDLGLGLSMDVPYGTLQGHRISVEWIQPLNDDVNGYQLERDGSLAATWSFMF